MRGLTGLAATSLNQRRGRSALTAIGITLGVAILFGVRVTSASLDHAVRGRVRGVAGPADVVVVPLGDNSATLPARLVQDLVTLPNVITASGSLTRNLAGRCVGASGQRDRVFTGLSVRGLDPVGLAQAPQLALAAGRQPAVGAAEVVVNADLARGLEITLGTRCVVNAPIGDRSLVTVGILAAATPDVATSQAGMYTSLSTAQSLATPGTGVDELLLVLDDGSEAKAWIAAHASAAPGGSMAPAVGADPSAGAFVDIVEGMLTSFAALALFVGAFLIYLTLTASVVERRALYGTLRALGATAGQVHRLVLAEALTLGAVATVVGLGLGLGIAAVLTRRLAGQLDIVGAAPVVVGASPIVVAVLLGVVVTAGAAHVPARRAARLSPVIAMSGDLAATTRRSRVWLLGVVSLGLGIGLLGANAGVAGVGIGTLLALLGAVLLVPSLLQPLSRVVGRVTRRVAPGVGAMAVAHLVKERSRSAYTLALVMVVLAQLFVMTAGSSSIRRTQDRVLERQFGADLLLQARGRALTANEVRTIAATPGVAAVTEMRWGRTRIVTGKSERFTYLSIIDPATYFTVQSFSWAAGDDASARAALSAGGAVLVSTVLAAQRDLVVGSPVTVRTLDGPHPFRVAGIFEGVGGGELAVGLPDGKRFFGAGPADDVALDVARGGSPAAVAEALGRRLAPDANGYLPAVGMRLRTAAEISRQEREELRGYFTIFYGVLAVAALVGLLGMANTLAMSVVQRYREIGMLRAVGTLRRQVFGMVLIEALTLTLVALLVALPLGWVLSVGLLRGSSASLGFAVEYVFPWRALPVLAGIAVLVGLVAAAAPARRAGRLGIVTALHVD